MGRHGDVKPLAPVMTEDEKPEEELEGRRWHDEEVHRSDAWGLVPQERAPALGRRPAALDHVLRNRRWGDVDTELRELAMDPAAAQSRLARLSSRIKLRMSVGIRGRAPIETSSPGRPKTLGGATGQPSPASRC